VSLAFSLLNPSVDAVSGVLNMGAQGANAEISAYNQASGYLYTVGGGSGAIVVSDLRNPTAAKIVAKAIPSVSGQTLQSVAVFGKLLAVAVQNSVKTDNGFVQFYDLTNPALPLHLSTVNVGALPDMVKFSSDGKKLLVTNEAEPNTTYTIDPVGSISLIDTTGYLATTPIAPDQAQVQTVDFSAWNNRKAELSNRGIRITGKAGVTTTLAQDIEPEAIAITADGNTAYVSLQENNGIAVLDIGTTTPKITSIFSAGIQDWDRGLATAKNFSYTLSYAAGAANLPAGVQAGGLSGLWFDGVETINGQALDIFYSITDRGPNGTLTAGKRQFLDPDFQPSIYKLGMNRATGAVSELAIIGLKRPDGTALTGLPQLQGKDEIPVDATNLNLAYDPFGIDSETISIFTASIGGVSRKVFAVGDEYRGQIGLFDFSTGKLIQRYIPAGQKALLQAQHGSVIGAETIDSLPAIYGNRWANRGIEGMAFNSKDGLLYAFMQSPLDIDSNGDGVAAERSPSQLTRILAIDPATGAPVKEHLYLLSGRSGQDKIGDVTYDASRGVFLVMERDSSRLLNGFKSVYEVDLRGATNTLPRTLGTGTASWLDAIGVTSPELLDNSLTLVNGVYNASSADRLAAAGIQLANKVELFNLPSVGGTLSYDKPEGLTLRDDGAVVINYDNDFGGEGASGNAFTVVSFSNPALDTEDSGDGGGYKPATNHDVYGLTMPDGLATFTYNGENFILAAGEGDDRNDFLDPDETSRVSVLLTAAAGATDAQKAGLLATNSRRLNILTNTGDLDRDGIVDQAYTLGSRSLRIFDSKGNVVFDSGTALEDLAFAKGLYPVNSREDDKGVEPEMVEVFTINGRTYAFVALERTTTSMAAIFDVTNPYAPVAVDPIQFPGAQRIEGITFLTTATNAARSVIASSEGNDVVSLVDFPIPYSLQILSYYGESGLLGIETAPILGALIDKFDDQYANTLKLGEGDTFIPGPWLIGGADPSLNAIPGIGSTALARPDFAIFNALGTDVSALGNHEFDLGSPVLQGAFAASGAWAGAQFPFITANLNFAADSSLRGLADASIGGSSANAFAGQEASAIKGKIAPYAVVTEGGEKIGIVGATTFDLLSKSSPNGTVPKDDADPSTSDLQEVALYVQAAVDVLRARGINKIVMVDQLDTLERNKALAPLLRGVDVMVAGGGHERLGDANDVPVAFNGHDADFIPTDRFPIVTAGADGKPTLIITTDTEFTYLGRLVVDFDANGEIILSNLNSIINGAYAATEANLQAAYGTTQSATEIIAGSVIGTKVKAISDAINNVIVSKDGTIFGYTNVYLEGDRVFGRTQEVNLGDITADANLAKAKAALGAGAVFASLKNGGGIRASIGSVGESGEKLPPAASPVKPVGAISLLDIENALRFDNKLMVFDSTPQGLLNILEFAAGLSSGAAQQSGGYAQIGGVHFSYDPSKPAGQKVQDVAIYDEAGNLVAKVADNGKLLAGAPATISVVALNFTANGGDGYPIKYLNPPTNSTVNNETGNFRYILANGTLSAPVNRNLDFTASTTFASVGLSNTDLLGEQKAFQDFLLANHATPETAYATTDTPASLDRRIQNLQVKTQDTVLTLDTLPNGVASGDVDQDSVVLWTRSTALGQATFEISTTADFAQIAGSASASVTNPNQPVKVEISGLNAGTDYFYRVIDAAGSMAKGSFETAAEAGRFTGLRFGISGDWRGELAPYPSIGNAAGKDLDFFVELGDTIYADVASDAVLNPDGSRKGQVTTLDEFRAKHEEVYSVRYGVNTWEDLRGSTAIYATIDDHEVINDFAGGAAAASDPRFGTTQGLINDTELFDNGLTAFQEYNPIRDVFNGNTGDSRTAGERDLYRFNRFGSDAASFLLDTRSFRDPELVAPNTANPADVARFLNESLSLDRTLLGADQLSRLKADLLSADRSGITWKFVMVPEPIQELGIYNTDAFEGYAKERKEILKFIETNGIRNVVFVAADIHGTMVNNLTYTEAVGGPRVATDTWEITTGSVAYSKPFGQTVVDFATAAGLLSAPQKAFYDSLPIAPDGDDLLNDKDDFLSKAFQDLVIGPAGYDPIGLNTNLTGGPGVIGSFDVSASLIQGDYVAAHTYGWTQFDIDKATQKLTVTTYGIDPYSEAELKANQASVLAREPRIVSQFTVEAQDTALEAQGNTKLLRRGDGIAFVESGAGTRQEITVPWGVSATVSDNNEWQMLAADTIIGVNQVLWRNNTSSFLHVWNLDANWNLQSTSGADGFNTPKAWELEASFQVDGNRDGIIGAPLTTLEAQGSTKLLRRGDGIAFVETASGTRQEITVPWGVSATVSDNNEWAMLAAEKIGDTNQVLWRNNNASFLHVWNLDANWNLQSTNGAYGFNTPAAWELETSFQVDGNRDGIIGAPV
jgi:phosphodiesterase/alkaline phosphatase D-like protein/2',3'-cyclic-nucleotide 2'-phosphodiesterase (5'-nucleotidase family)